MRLRTLAGAYAGEVRNYSLTAARAALRTGTAERLEGDLPPPAPFVPTVRVKKPTKKTARSRRV